MDPSIITSLFGAGADIWNMVQQKKNTDYMKNIQQQIFDREDNAVQRRAKDMEAAGLSKNLAAGGAANAGAAVQTTPPELKAQNAQAAMNIMMQKASIHKTEQEAKLIEQKTETEDYNTQIAQAQSIIQGAEAELRQGHVMVKGKKITYVDWQKNQSYYNSLLPKQQYETGLFDQLVNKFAAEIEAGEVQRVKARYGPGEKIPHHQLKDVAAYAKWAGAIAAGKSLVTASEMGIRDKELYAGTWKGVPSNQTGGSYSREFLSAIGIIDDIVGKGAGR